MLLPFAFDQINAQGVEVHIKGTSAPYRGRAYDGIPGLARTQPESRFLVIVALSRVKKRLPGRIYLGSKRLAKQFGPEGVPVAGWEEIFVYISAHEARHIWQFRRRRDTGQRGLREVDAEQYALARLAAWRMQNGDGDQ